MTMYVWNVTQTDVFSPSSFNENAKILKKIRLKFICKVVIYPKSALIKEIDRCRVLRPVFSILKKK